MARGFGATVGGGTTDIITSALTSRPTQRSYHLWFNRAGAGGANAGRLWDAPTTTDLCFVSDVAGQVNFQRKWSVASGAWFITEPSAGSWYALGISYDGGADTNDPVMYINGASQSVTETVAPSGTFDTTTSAYSIGNRASDGVRVFNGTIAEFAVWDAILTAPEFAALGKGFSPLLIRPAALAEYVPMVRANISQKLAAPSITGTAVQPHIRMIYPRAAA
jgi:hypothetical protein